MLVTTVKSGATLAPNTYLLSPTRTFKLIYQSDGNLVLYKDTGEFVWNNGKVFPGGRLVMKHNGELTAYDSSNRPVWSTGTSRYPSGALGIREDGHVAIYYWKSGQCATAWSTWSK